MEGILDPKASLKDCSTKQNQTIQSLKRPSNLKLTGRAQVIGSDSETQVKNVLRFEAFRFYKVYK